VPLVSVLLAVHDDARYLPSAVESVLRQTVDDLELIVVDDGSTDATPGILSTLTDPRVAVLRNDRQLGLAASLNRGLDRAAGRYVARLDADDVALPNRLELQLARMSEVAVLGSAVLDLDEAGRPGRLHRNPLGPRAVRWLSLFSSPFFHPTVLVARDALGDLRYDPAYLESEDYALWTRLLAKAEGANLAEPLVLKRVHPGQASLRRAELQQSFQRQVALREIERIAPELSPEEAERAWAGERDAYLALLAAFERTYGVDAEVHELVDRRLGKRTPRLLARRMRRLVDERAARRRVPSVPPRVAVVSPEPTPYRSPLFDRIAERADVDLTVIYAARTVAGRTWQVEPHHRAVFLSGPRVPGLGRVLRHDYPLTLGIGGALREARPDVVVVSGWSTFASQAAIAWSRAHRIPYVLLVESHDLGPRAGWRRAVKGAVVPRLVRAAASVLVVGTAARESVVVRGAPPERVRVFANTVDVPRWIERAQRLTVPQHDDVVVLSVGRAVAEKGLDVLAAACDEAGVRLETVLGGASEDELARRYVEADIFALLSRQETWGVVVTEAAASGLPLVLSDRVGAAYDLLRDGENGFLVPADDVGAAARGLRTLAEDADLRRSMGEASRELVRGWGYEPSVENFLAAVREALALRAAVS
jgi:glycosyltransferase involved in cell wall biosynthesis